MKRIDTGGSVCFNRGMTSDTMKPLPDIILDELLHLPRVPAHPLVGNGYKRARFPQLGHDVVTRRLWASIPAAHKHEELRCISPEAFNVVVNFIVL